MRSGGTGLARALQSYVCAGYSVPARSGTRCLSKRLRASTEQALGQAMADAKSLITRLNAIYRGFFHALTVGVRGAILDEHNRVFLVRHTYVRGWHLPGGGVEVGE